jgi:hypothetical protein
MIASQCRETIMRRSKKQKEKPEETANVIPSIETDYTSLLREGKWQVTDTVLSDRKNLFCMSHDSGFHIATIVSGSRSQLNRFEDSLVLMRAAPEMYRTLQMVREVIESNRTQPSSSLDSIRATVEATLSRATSPFKEG